MTSGSNGADTTSDVFASEDRRRTWTRMTAGTYDAQPSNPTRTYRNNIPYTRDETQ